VAIANALNMCLSIVCIDRKAHSCIVCKAATTAWKRQEGVCINARLTVSLALLVLLCVPPCSQVRDHMHSRAYIGQYSASGDFFIAAYQVGGSGERGSTAREGSGLLLHATPCSFLLCQSNQRVLQTYSAMQYRLRKQNSQVCGGRGAFEAGQESQRQE
jgi:hypothetical protein